ncbi:hypothetical protein F5890DRAFT_1536412 [Lentinula detonsa]|uniref:Uncharacterized protein n=1 Tax=Lentinula detonsa TaxID=2804962 RepID=A0AA38PT42_9AGAR|nr:hypothetical protein F5890DRAFT_1536412 [Lentinula detonsa]
MNSYPIELIAHLSPVMFVAGLDPPPGPPPGPSGPTGTGTMGTGTSTASTTSSGMTSSGTTGMRMGMGMGTGTSSNPTLMGTIPIRPPAPTHHSRNSSSTTLPTLPSLPTLLSYNTHNTHNNLRPSPRPPGSDEFTMLRSRLRDMFLGQRKIEVWDARGDKDDTKATQATRLYHPFCLCFVFEVVRG